MRTAKVKKFFVQSTPHGPTAVGFNARWNVVNSINGSKSDTIAHVTRAARNEWPDAKQVQLTDKR